MKIYVTNNNGETVISIDGRLDTATAPELESLLAEQYEGTTFLILDCEKMPYITSAGLRVFLTAHKRMKGAMKVIHVNESVVEVLDITGFTDIFTVENSL